MYTAYISLHQHSMNKTDNCALHSLEARKCCISFYWTILRLGTVFCITKTTYNNINNSQRLFMVPFVVTSRDTAFDLRRADCLTYVYNWSKSNLGCFIPLGLTKVGKWKQCGRLSIFDGWDICQVLGPSYAVPEKIDVLSRRRRFVNYSGEQRALKLVLN